MVIHGFPVDLGYRKAQKDQKDQFLLSQNRSNSGYDLDHYSNSNDRYDLKIFKGLSHYTIKSILWIFMGLKNHQRD